MSSKSERQRVTPREVDDLLIDYATVTNPVDWQLAMTSVRLLEIDEMFYLLDAKQRARLAFLCRALGKISLEYISHLLEERDAAEAGLPIMNATSSAIAHQNGWDRTSNYAQKCPSHPRIAAPRFGWPRGLQCREQPLSERLAAAEIAG